MLSLHTRPVHSLHGEQILPDPSAMGAAELSECSAGLDQTSATFTSSSCARAIADPMTSVMVTAQVLPSSAGDTNVYSRL